MGSKSASLLSRYDPTADFLARERAALGDDADFFQSDSNPSNSKSPSASANPAQGSAADIFSPALSASNSNNNNDLLGDSFEPTPAPAAAAASSASLEQQSVVSGGASSSVKSPPLGSSASQFQQEWQAKQRDVIEERDRVSEERHEVMVKEAREAIDKFYEEYNEKKDKAIEENRANQEIELQAANKGNLWERAVKQIDLATKASQDQKSSAAPTAGGSSFSASSPFASTSNLSRQASQQQQQQDQKQNVRDTSRMRELLQDLKRDKDAPGVKAKKVEASA
ncbi:hypothetical protein GQ54DRAFT_329451 [Martensiomyces pterosporus]|nr:hypothetical protein GQ54DRAFT_329451 [Martensiomyces pterosporus]